MKKNELVHLHALLARLGSDSVERGTATRADFEAYRDLDVSPTTLTASRADHRRAVQMLASTLADALDAERGASTGDDSPPTRERPPTGNH